MSQSTNCLLYLRPFDAHLHLRDGEMLIAVLAYSARQFVAAIIMPNLSPPVVTTKEVNDYRSRIISAIPPGRKYFTPYMTTYLTEETDSKDIRIGFDEKVFIAAKLYPPHGTTNSAHGVVEIEKIFPVLEVMEEIGMPLCVHGEMPPSSGIDIFDREAVFIEERLIPILERFKKLKVVLEHITTEQSCNFITSTSYNVQATITPQHLLLDRNALFDGGLHSDLYCMPILKRKPHMLAIQKAVLSGNPRFGLGTDSAPHLNENKFKPCGCAGVFSAPVALEAYFQFFYEKEKLDIFENFISKNMASFYNLSLPNYAVTIEHGRENIWKVPETIEGIMPLYAGRSMNCRAKIIV